MKKLIIILILIPFIVSSQDKINGMVMESFGASTLPIPGANVIWEGPQQAQPLILMEIFL